MERIYQAIKRLEEELKLKINDWFIQTIIESDDKDLFIEKAEYCTMVLTKDLRKFDNKTLRGHELSLVIDTMNIVREKIKREPQFSNLHQYILNSNQKTDKKAKDFINFLELIIETLEEVEYSTQGIVENPGPAGPIFDINYLVTSNYPKIAVKNGTFHFSNDFNNWVYDKFNFTGFIDQINKPKKEFKINKYITLKLEKEYTTREITNIYIGDKKILNCKSILIRNAQLDERLEEIDSIDEVAAIIKSDLKGKFNKEDLIDAETEFWGHCSNIQAWVEHNYDTRLLHMNVAFPLLKELYHLGVKEVKIIFQEEIAKRFESKFEPVIEFLYRNKYYEFLTGEQKESLKFPEIYKHHREKKKQE